MDCKVYHPVSVAKVVVIPGNELDKVVIEGNVSPGILSGKVGITVKIAGDNLVLSVVQDALEGTFQCLLHYLLDVIIFGNFLQGTGQIHHCHVGVGHMEGHVSELPIQFKDDLAVPLPCWWV